MVLQFGANICRICLCEISGHASVDLTECTDEFHYVTLLEFSENDRLPKSICAKCHVLLKIATIVKRTALSSEQKFKIIIQNAKKNFMRNINSVNALCSDKDLEELTALLPLEERQAISNTYPLSQEYSRKPQIFSKESSNVTQVLEPNISEHTGKYDTPFDNDCREINNFLKVDDSLEYRKIKTKTKPSAKVIDVDLNRQIRVFKTEWVKKFQPWLIEKDNKAYCIFCGVHLSNIISHIYRHNTTLKHSHNANLVKIGIHNKKMEQPLQKYKCRLCERSYMTKIKLLGHYKIHENGESNVKCGICFKQFRLVENLKEHLKSHVNHKASFKCIKCCEKFPRKATLLQHILTCDRSILINFQECLLCTATFTSFDDFYNHMNLNHDTINEDCFRCGLNFQTETSLRNHLMDHDILKVE